MTLSAKDGLPARVGGPWTQDKLKYLEKYAGAFMTAMAPKRKEGKWDRLVYIDLLAGPGLGIDASRGTEFNGSPLIALSIKPPFDRLFLADFDEENVRALKTRIPAEDKKRVDLRCGDCNVLVKEVIDKLSARTLGLAFVDPEGFEVQFSTLETVARRRIDLLYLFPSGIGIRRNLSLFLQQERSPMDHFWGDSKWRELPLAKRAAGELTSHEELQLDRDWVSSFRKKVAALGLKYYDKSDPMIRNNQNAAMYHLLFFSHDSAGLKIWKGIKRIEASGQRGLQFKD